MGAKTAIIMYSSEHPAAHLTEGLDADATSAAELVARAFPGSRFEAIGASDLDSQARPAEGLVYAGSFPGVDVLTCAEFMFDRPSDLPAHLLALADGRAMYLHCMHSVVDWAAFGVYRGGAWVRSYSLSPDGGVIEDLGEPFEFEEPYRAGRHSIGADYPLPFHPLDLGEQAMGAFFGFTMEGMFDGADLDAEEITLQGFRFVP